jgi:hypothetical protein
MPPEKPLWPRSKAEFNLLAEQEKERFLPTMRRLHLHQLVGLHAALQIAMEEFKEAAAREDQKRGVPPSGHIGNRPD